jgi:probable rRNA maturation factor
MCESFELLIEAPAWQEVWPTCETDASTLITVMEQQGLLRDAFFSIVLTDDAAVQDLNRQFRGRDKPTNVLSFPDGTRDPDSGRTYLGDLVLALQTITEEARNQGKLFPAHAQHMLVHGALHLLGYTHDEDEHAAQMEDLERSALAAVGIPDPYAC